MAERRRERSYARLGGCALGAILGLLSLLYLTAPESAGGRDRTFDIVILAGILVLFGFPALIGLAIWRGGLLTLVPFCIGVGLVFGGVSIREDLHWRWSRADFNAAASDPGRSWYCSRDEPCVLGWWTVTGVEDIAGSSVFWLEESVCGESSALGRAPTARDRTRLLDAASGREGMQTDLRTWYDDWVALCFST